MSNEACVGTITEVSIHTIATDAPVLTWVRITFINVWQLKCLWNKHGYQINQTKSMKPQSFKNIIIVDVSSNLMISQLYQVKPVSVQLQV